MHLPRQSASDNVIKGNHNALDQCYAQWRVRPVTATEIQRAAPRCALGFLGYQYADLHLTFRDVHCCA